MSSSAAEEPIDCCGGNGGWAEADAATKQSAAVTLDRISDSPERSRARIRPNQLYTIRPPRIFGSQRRLRHLPPLGGGDPYRTDLNDIAIAVTCRIFSAPNL